MLLLYTLLAQFGDGFEPINDNRYTTGSDTTDGVLTNTELVVSNIIGTLTILGGVFFIIYFITAAIMWLTSGSDSGKLTKARDQMIQGVLGLIILVSSYTIIGLVGSIVGLDVLNLKAQITTLLAL